MKLFNTNNIETVKACQDSSRLNYLVTSWRNVVKFESKMKCLITVRLCIHVLYTSLFAQKEQHRRKQTIKKQQQTTKQTGTNADLTMISSHDVLGLLMGHH